MLAYVFWHWRRPEVAGARYEATQRAFHDALRTAPPAGFVRSHSAALSGAPWANAGAEAYEDWYLVEDSAALDPLNDGAVSASRRVPHDAAAGVAAGGTAGLYVLRGGAALERPAVASWFSKPAGATYDAVDQTVSGIVRAGQGALWMRRMVLGPAPEFCLHSHARVKLPWPVQPIALRTVWPVDGG